MSLTETPAANGGRVREGFVRDEPPTPPLVEPRDTPPQAPLPSQMKLDQPPPEAPLSVADQARADIAANPDKWPLVIELLYKPIKNEKGELLTALSFREPRAAEINRIGNPVRLLWDNEILIEERKMKYIMGALSGLFPPTIEQMDPRDWNSCANKLREFFLPDLRAYPRRSSTTA
jgi:hypothetical protein